jgi:hypothetical protein
MNNPILIPMEDDLLHTNEHPFCDDPTCGCHEDSILIGEILTQVKAGTLTPEEATDLISGKGK